MGLFGLIPLWDISPVSVVAAGYCCCPLCLDCSDDLFRFVGHRLVGVNGLLMRCLSGSALLLLCFCSSTR